MYRYSDKSRLRWDRRWLLTATIAAVGMALVGAARAQSPTSAQPAAALAGAVSNEWGAMVLQQQHLQDKLNELLVDYKKVQGEAAAAAETEGRLKWVLDNWVGAKVPPPTPTSKPPLPHSEPAH